MKTLKECFDMSKKLLILSIPIFIALAVILSYQITSLFLLNQDQEKDDKYTENIYEDEEDSYPQGADDVVPADSITINKITPATKIVYQYYYAKDDQLISDVGEPPYYLIDMTKSQFENYFDEWELISFSSEEAVLRKSFLEKEEEKYYLIQEFDGQIAVFYDYTEDFAKAFEDAVTKGRYKLEQQDGFFNEFIRLNKDIYIKEILDIPLELLSSEEQEHIKKGFMIYGDEELIKLIENYSS